MTLSEAAKEQNHFKRGKNMCLSKTGWKLMPVFDIHGNGKIFAK